MGALITNVVEHLRLHLGLATHIPRTPPQPDSGASFDAARWSRRTVALGATLPHPALGGHHGGTMAVARDLPIDEEAQPATVGLT